MFASIKTKIKINQMRKSILFILLLFSLSILISSCKKDGEVGPAGKDGLVGAAGADGSQIYSGQGVPAADRGINGDYYLDLNTGILYGPKADGNWAEGFGLSGENGINGSNGTNGTNGIDGSAIHSGLNLPVTETGLPEGYNVGDFFLDTDEYLLYGPLKEIEGAASWGPGLMLKGNANVKTYKLTIPNNQWSITVNTDDEFRYKRIHFSALTNDIMNNGCIFVYEQYYIGGWRPLPITYASSYNNLHVWEYATGKNTDGNYLRIGESLDILAATHNEALGDIATKVFKIIIVQGEAADLVLTGGTKKISIKELSKRLSIEL